MTNNLLIGPGSWKWDGWTSVDANPDNAPDILATLPPLPESVTRRRWDQILASHFIEHLYIWEAKVLLRQCYDCLKVGGVLTLEQPNLDYCVRIMAGVIDPPEGRDREQFGYWGIYGAPNGNPWDGHKAGYSPTSLTALLVDAGFEVCKIVQKPGHYHEVERDFQLEATK